MAWKIKCWLKRIACSRMKLRVPRPQWAAVTSLIDNSVSACAATPRSIGPSITWTQGFCSLSGWTDILPQDLVKSRSGMMKSSNGNIFRVTGHLCGEFPAQKPVTRSFVFFYLRLNKRLIKQSWDWWFETLSRPLWRHRNGLSTNKHNVLLFVASLWLRHGSLWIQLAHLPLYFTLLYCDWAII